MSIEHHGNRLLRFLMQATETVVLAAPFIKLAVLQRCLAAVPVSVPVLVVTRWRPEEIAAGVSDLEVFDAVRHRPGGTLKLVHALHAKYYRADGEVLLGSANLTDTALGWGPNPNIELLVPIAASTAGLKSFEAFISTSGVEPDERLRDLMAELVATLPRPLLGPESAVLDSANTLEGDAISFHRWLPSTRDPRNLLLAYRGQFEELTSSGKEQIALGWPVLRPVPLLSDDALRRSIGLQLLQHPLVVRIDQLVAQRPRRFGELKAVVGEWCRVHAIRRDPTDTWQTLMRWLTYFAREQYFCEASPYSEVLHRRGPRAS